MFESWSSAEALRAKCMIYSNDQSSTIVPTSIWKNSYLELQDRRWSIVELMAHINVIAGLGHRFVRANSHSVTVTGRPLSLQTNIIYSYFFHFALADKMQSEMMHRGKFGYSVNGNNFCSVTNYNSEMFQFLNVKILHTLLGTRERRTDPWQARIFDRLHWQLRRTSSLPCFCI